MTLSTGPTLDTTHVFVKSYSETLEMTRLCKKKLNTNHDTHCIKIGVQLWSEWRDSNPRPLGPEPSAIPNFATPG